MYIQFRTKQLFALLVLNLVISPAWSDLDETYRVSLGYALNTYDTELRITSQNNAIDKEIDLEDDLGFNSNVEAGWLSLLWRTADRHHIRFTYLPFNRSTEYSTRRDLSVGGNIIRSGAFIRSNMQSQVFDINYIYSFFKRPATELGFSAGLYWLKVSTEIVAAGEIRIEGELEDEFKSDYTNHTDIHAPMPLIGFIATHEINSSWRVHGNARYLDVSINNVDGRILNLGVNTDYYFTKHWGVGLSLSTFEVKVRHEGIVFINNLSYSYEGIQAYFVFKY